MALVTTPSVERIIGCAIDVHRVLGPGLFESVYVSCVAHRMTQAGLRFRREVLIPVRYEDAVMAPGFRADFIVEQEVLLELKSVRRIEPVHQAQLLTYLKMSGLKKGLLINFNVELLKQGIKSMVL